MANLKLILFRLWQRTLSTAIFHGRCGRFLVVLAPLSWVILFFAIPFIIVLKISFSESVFAVPPYIPLIEWISDHALSIRFNLFNYLFLLRDKLYVASYFTSLTLAGTATLCCLIIGYPMAYGIAQSSPRWRIILLLMVILPFWTSFLIRVYAWIGMLNNHGVINNCLIYLGIIKYPLQLLNNNFAIGIGIVYSYLPFMILPLYGALEKADPSLLEVAADLGARPIHTFYKIILPLSLKGIMAGSMLVFIPAMGEFVIPELLGGSDNLMIGKILWVEFFNNQDWPLASAITIALLILLVLPMVVFQRLQMRRSH